MPSPSPGDLPDPGTERVSSVAPALAGRFFTTELPGKAVWKICVTSVKYVTTNGEGSGTPLQYSCLENPVDGGACRLQAMGSLRVD